MANLSNAVERHPRVSVVIPAYNAERVLEEAVRSILVQSYTDFELLVLDDCSSDGTLALARALAAEDHRIRVVANDTNLGIAGNRNAGVQLARGELIAWQDADDISLPHRLEHQVDFLDQHPEVGMVGGFLQFFGGRRETVRRYAEDDAALRRAIFRYSPVAQPAAMIRRELLLRVGPYSSTLEAEDLDMSFRLGRVSAFANLQEVVIRYRENPTSATFTRLRKIERDTLHIRRMNAGRDYRMTALDRVYNGVQALSAALMPPRLRIELFNLLRNRPHRHHNP